MRHFIYTLRLIPKFRNEGNWTEKEAEIVSEHFNRLKNLQDEGKLILAGKTDAENDVGFGIVIFKAKNIIEAKKIMDNDPAVIKGIMTAELNNYKVALISAENI